MIPKLKVGTVGINYWEEIFLKYLELIQSDAKLTNFQSTTDYIYESGPIRYNKAEKFLLPSDILALLMS